MEMKHPIDSLMVTAMNSIKEMIDVNTIIGDSIQALNNTVIIPISKVGFGFAAGGCEFNDETVNSYNRKEKEENINYRLPFGGGSGAGVNITPVAFLIVQNDSVKLLEATHSSVLDKLVEYVPDAIEKINQLFNKKLDNEKKEEYEEYDDYDDDLDWEDEDDFIDENLDDEKSENQDGDNNYSNEEENGNKQNGYDIEIEKEEYSKKQGKNGNNKKIKEKIIKKRTDKKTDNQSETNKEKNNNKINSKEKKLESKIKSIIVDDDEDDD